MFHVILWVITEPHHGLKSIHTFTKCDLLNLDSQQNISCECDKNMFYVVSCAIAYAHYGPLCHPLWWLKIIAYMNFKYLNVDYNGNILIIWIVFKYLSSIFHIVTCKPLSCTGWRGYYTGVHLACASRGDHGVKQHSVHQGAQVSFLCCIIWGSRGPSGQFTLHAERSLEFSLLLWSRAACPEVLWAPDYWPGP